MLMFLLACGEAPVQIGDFSIESRGDGAFDVSHASRPFRLEGLRPFGGEASGSAEMQFGSFRFDEVSTVARPAAAARRLGDLYELTDADGAFLGLLSFSTTAAGDLVFTVAPSGSSYVGFSADCGDDAFLGLGSHAFDVDHRGESFPLWTSEPGIGKSDTDELPGDWFLTGTRHATSFPLPFALRPRTGGGMLLDTMSRVDVDLCASNPDRFSMAAWQAAPLSVVVFAGDNGLDVVRRLSSVAGRPSLPPPWVFAPWNDAVRGPERVRAVARSLREAGAPSSVIWSEDWKGAEDTSRGYHLTGEWFVDPEKYPDASGLAAELEAAGFKWFAYFSPFVTDGTVTWDDAVANDVLVGAPDGSGPYTFVGATFEPVSMVDLSTAAGRSWAQGYMKAALDVGFDGWMADYAEWLPVDAVLGSGASGWEDHNAYPLQWQATNAEAVAGEDASFFVRSGWTGTAALAPVVWAGDQRTSFDVDDGLPTVIPLGLGLSACGVPVYTHDVAGYQSIGNAPTSKELFFRWAWLGAFSPILRTHHGAFADDNWQFDSDAETLAHWAVVAREHTRLWPYRYGLAAQATRDGTPMLRPIGLQFPDEDVSRVDAWMLGDALLVAPVLVEAATGRDVDLPGAVGWYDWFTRAPVTSGRVDADPTQIPVFAAAGTTVPVFTTVPDTLFDVDDPSVIDLSAADEARTVYLFAGGGEFVEGDGTVYQPTGAPTGAGEVTQALTSGTIEVAGVSLAIDGPHERTYTVVVVP